MDSTPDSRKGPPTNWQPSPTDLSDDRHRNALQGCVNGVLAAEILRGGACERLILPQAATENQAAP
jgi:hypothetical protein